MSENNGDAREIPELILQLLTSALVYGELLQAPGFPCWLTFAYQMSWNGGTIGVLPSGCFSISMQLDALESLNK
jgi:hypothetical protein